MIGAERRERYRKAYTEVSHAEKHLRAAQNSLTCAVLTLGDSVIFTPIVAGLLKNAGMLSTYTWSVAKGMEWLLRGKQK